MTFFCKSFCEIFLGWIWGGMRTALTYIYHIFPHICPPVTQSWRHEHEKEWERGWSDPYSRIRSNLLLITARPSPSLSRQRGVKQAEPSSPHDPSDNSSVNTHTHKKKTLMIYLKWSHHLHEHQELEFAKHCSTTPSTHYKTKSKQ